MTTLGKTLVFINLVLAIVFASWAIGLFTNTVPWHTPATGDGPKIQGLVEELKGVIGELTKARDAADIRWANATLELQETEKRRPQLQQLHANRITSARRGNVPGIDPPVQQIEFQGEYIKPTGAPFQVDGANALPFDGYAKSVQDKIREIADAEEQVKKLIEETRVLTIQIDGFDPPGGAERTTADQKGLRRRLLETQKQADDLRLEQEYLRSPLTNYLLDNNLLKKRQAALKARLQELATSTAEAKR